MVIVYTQIYVIIDKKTIVKIDNSIYQIKLLKKISLNRKLKFIKKKKNNNYHRNGPNKSTFYTFAYAIIYDINILI